MTGGGMSGENAHMESLFAEVNLEGEDVEVFDGSPGLSFRFQDFGVRIDIARGRRRADPMANWQQNHAVKSAKASD
jgi:hypothetical protein